MKSMKVALLRPAVRKELLGFILQDIAFSMDIDDTNAGVHLQVLSQLGHMDIHASSVKVIYLSP